MPAIVANAIEAEFHLSAAGDRVFCRRVSSLLRIDAAFRRRGARPLRPEEDRDGFLLGRRSRRGPCPRPPRISRMLIAGQILLGIGSAPAFLAVLLFIANAFPPNRFTSISGYAMSFGGLGMLATATPLAFVVQTYSWRASFALLAIASALALVAAFFVVRDREPCNRAPDPETLATAFKQADPAHQGAADGRYSGSRRDHLFVAAGAARPLDRAAVYRAPRFHAGSGRQCRSDPVGRDAVQSDDLRPARSRPALAATPHCRGRARVRCVDPDPWLGGAALLRRSTSR